MVDQQRRVTEEVMDPSWPQSDNVIITCAVAAAARFINEEVGAAHVKNQHYILPNLSSFLPFFHFDPVQDQQCTGCYDH